MFEQKFLPESVNPITKVRSFSDLSSLVNTPISVRPLRWSTILQGLTVLIDDKFEGIIPSEELSLYDLTYFEGETIPKEINSIFIRNSNVSAIITEISENGVFLSRKENMKNAFSYFKEKIDYFFNGIIIGNCKSKLFVDIGAGIIGSLGPNETSNSFIHDLRVYKQKTLRSDNIRFKILEVNNSYKSFNISYKATLTFPSFDIGDIVPGIISTLLIDNSGVFVELHPLVSGILDLDNEFIVMDNNSNTYFDNYNATKKLIIGHTYTFLLKRKSEKGYHLKFIG